MIIPRNCVAFGQGVGAATLGFDVPRLIPLDPNTGCGIGDDLPEPEPEADPGRFSASLESVCLAGRGGAS